LAMLRTTANTDLGIEHLLSAVRKELLMARLKESLRKSHIQSFALALVRQAEINEYVFAVSDQERQRLEQIFIKIDAVRDGSRAALDNLLLKALYVPISRLLADGGTDMDCQAIRPKALADLISTHMAERRVQAEMAQDIKSLGIIDNDVSQNVARLYEQNPYPRWTSLHVPTPPRRRQHFLTYFSKQALSFMDSPYKVLIAGSGTGQQAIDAALGYGPNAVLTAIDLSLASLAYGKRMAGQFEADNVQFIQCDILNVDLLERQFDVIECIGVLHHMDDPWAGWKILVDNLRPGGLMKIGLYSRAARRTIASLREDIKARGVIDDDQAIRDYRQNIMTQGEDGKAAFLLQSADFYSLSNFWDLMFHVSEQHLTILEISAFMAANGLTFHGFHIPHDIAPEYPIGDDSHDLEKWRRFENAHPDTFKGMYVFWCRKD
ncbi:MAG TPA: class I SAM-dependent methyltransferase, partial [Rhodospirillales bacterium]|nr:class I SAM-dependent methyltransferase [Rhodospirillales bacterium]